MTDISERDRSPSRTDGRPSEAVDGAIGSRIGVATDPAAGTVTFMARGTDGRPAATEWILVDESLVVDVAEMG
ncbi:hypothetical protein [Haloarchaeobius litoreus]|uniref:Uncharacterized protein n=1 Tax=Haloarchaeobius litoreus TaxID=755306 RepID=A0ABD6DCQ5_9EURY|nr:hypothetical protein [Haloarchaeobius litoreus]